jgi:hypothetical protein
MSLFIFGDSHAEFNFNGLCTGDINVLNIVNLREYSITMHRVGRDKILPHFSKNYNNDNNIFIIVYGEVDARCHIKRQLDLGRNLNDIIDELVDDYFITIKSNVCVYKQIIICSVNPPVDKIKFEEHNGVITHDFPILGTNEERVLYTKMINNKIKENCCKYGFDYLNTYDPYADESGILKFELSDKNCHIKQNSMVIEALKNIIKK